MKILIFGLPGSGKTWLAERLQKRLECAWFNADEVRRMANDWEFSEAARYRQAHRMASIANHEKYHDRTVICDFVCPTEVTRAIYDADYTVWMDTISRGRFEDTNDMFETPEDIDYHVSEWFEDTHQKLLEVISAWMLRKES